MLNDVDMERVKLQEERARMEIAKTLQSSTRPDSGLSRAEIDAAVKYAEVNEIFYQIVLSLSWYPQQQQRAALEFSLLLFWSISMETG